MDPMTGAELALIVALRTVVQVILVRAQTRKLQAVVAGLALTGGCCPQEAETPDDASKAARRTGRTLRGDADGR